VREKRGLSYSAYSYFYPLKVEGPFMMGLQTRNDQAEQALSVLRDTLAAFIADGPGADELKASKSNITGGFVLRLDSNRKWLEQVSQIAFYQLPLNYLDVFTQKVEAVTLEQIKDAWKRRINPQSMRTVLVGGGARGANGVTGSNAR
jgi:zinc protease